MSTKSKSCQALLLSPKRHRLRMRRLYIAHMIHCAITQKFCHSQRVLVGIAQQRKGMRSLCLDPETPSFSMSRSSASGLSTPRFSYSESGIDQCIEAAEALVLKWNPEASAFAKVTSLFYEDRHEAMHYIKCVNQLQKAMDFLLSDNSSSQKLVLAHKLMQMAMKRLQKEFYQILSMNRAHLDPESMSTRSSRTSIRSSISDFDDDATAAEDDVPNAGDSISEVEQVSSIAMADLRSIAECMISAGYGKECIGVYKVIRKSIIDEGIYRLNVEKVSSSKINKMDWQVLELKTKTWLEAVKISVRTLFTGEKILCDHVFRAFESIRESCFAEISREGAGLLFGFPELVARTKKSPPEKMFRVLDMYTALGDLWPEIESIFSSESTSAIRSQAFESMVRITESVRTFLSKFESTIQKHSSKSPASGGVHSLTTHAMDYLANLADYNNILSEIFADWPPPSWRSMPESVLYSPDSNDLSVPALTARIAWLILVLICKLDGKAKHHKDVSLAYLFLANNLHHVVFKVHTSNLLYVLGEDWLAKHESKLAKFVGNYEKLMWGEVISSLPENPRTVISPAEAKEIFSNFNFKFEQAYRKQRPFIITDMKLREQIKASIHRKVVPTYRQFYDTHRITVGSAREMAAHVVFTPRDIEGYLSDLFFGGITADDVSSSSASSATSSPLRRHS
ncbi:hypothetical protein L6164_009865 [Bauhinia variegata]|uniref:Uncharacterized protein n=1 Tax=Bauhinia variegata TaxID=167791 RepID=A0ACB9PLH8_BAUVA|nr:hypothetical protein L6164_009865 [Bauhinia variegata]